MIISDSWHYNFTNNSVARNNLHCMHNITVLVQACSVTAHTSTTTIGRIKI